MFKRPLRTRETPPPFSRRPDTSSPRTHSSPALALPDLARDRHLDAWARRSRRERGVCEEMGNREDDNKGRRRTLRTGWKRQRGGGRVAPHSRASCAQNWASSARWPTSQRGCIGRGHACAIARRETGREDRGAPGRASGHRAGHRRALVPSLRLPLRARGFMYCSRGRGGDPGVMACFTSGMAIWQWPSCHFRRAPRRTAACSPSLPSPEA